MAIAYEGERARELENEDEKDKCILLSLITRVLRLAYNIRRNTKGSYANKEFWAKQQQLTAPIKQLVSIRQKTAKIGRETNYTFICVRYT